MAGGESKQTVRVTGERDPMKKKKKKTQKGLLLRQR